MNKLLCANFFRLRKSKLFWGMTIAVFLFTVALMLLGARADAERQLGRSLDYYYFIVTPYSGFICAAFASLFVGTEFTDGTIRNKIAVGHTRILIYFSDLFTCLVAATVFSFAWAIGGLIGIPNFGLWNGGLSAFLVKYFVFYCTLLSLTVIFNMFAHIFSANKAGGAVFAVLFALILIFAAAYFVNSLYEQEFTYSSVTITEADGVQYGDLIENPAYIGGSLREIYEMISYILPTGQQMRLADESFAESPIMVGISLIESAVMATIGCLFFRKKDLK